MCAISCSDELECNAFRIEYGICTFGFLHAIHAIASTENNSQDDDDSEVEVFLKGIISPVRIGNNDDVSDDKLSVEPFCKVMVTSNEYYSERHVNKEDLTIAGCLNRCKTQNKKFALIDYGTCCYCTDTLPSSDFVPTSECQHACSGEPGSEGKCGGPYRWSVHVITI